MKQISRLILPLFIALTLSSNLLAQKASKNRTFGININSKSYFIGGLDYRFNDSKNGFYNFEVVNIKHPNEIRFISGVTNANLFGSRPYILGKNNYLIALRAQKGFEKKLFKPDQYEGVGVKAIFAGGISIGFLKPYFIKYLTLSDEVVQEQFDPSKHSNFDKIQGPSGLFYRFEKTKIVPGLNFKSALLFEYQGFKHFRTTVETGFLVEAYAKKLEIIPRARQEFLYVSVYAIISIGKNNKANR